MKFPRRRPVGGWLKGSFVGILVSAVLLVLLVWRLGTMVPGLSPAEAVAQAGSSSLSSIFHNPINAPQRLLQYGFQTTGQNGAFWLRLASVLFAVFFAYCFYSISRRWFGRFTGMMGALLLIGMPWFVLSARSAQPTVMMLSFLAVLAAYDWFQRSDKPLLPWLALVVASAVCVYSPGGAWLILASLLLVRKSFAAVSEKLGTKRLTTGFTLGFLLLVPLGWALVLNPGIWHDFLLIPSHWQAPLTLVKSIAWSALALVWRAPYHIDITLDRLPLMNITLIVLSLLGLFVFWTKARKELYGLLALATVGVLLSGINHNLYLLTLCLPSVGLISAAGLRYLYGEWRSVFPLNPLPKALALVLICLLVGLHLIYGARYALTAWPNSVATESTYVLK